MNLEVDGKIAVVTGAGGSRRETTTSPDLSFPDLSFPYIDPEDMKSVLALDYLGAVIPSQAAARIFSEKKSGVILNISSVAGILPLTRSLTYSDGKAAPISFTKWLAVHMAAQYSPVIRVNSIAPGFVLTDQNRFLLVDEDTGRMTERGEQILHGVPMARYGEPGEIAGAALWLVSAQASFVTGAVIPVDGGFTAYCGV